MTIHLTPTKQFLVANRDDYGMLIEAYVSFIYHRFVKQGSKVIDAGVNAGMHFIPLLRHVGIRGHVFGYEANPDLVEKVTSRAINLGIINFSLYSKGLFSAPGKLEFVVYPDNLGLSHLRHHGPIHSHAQGLTSKIIKVPVTILDDLKNEEISFIKMDLEGADFPALKGGYELLERHKPFIIFEFGRHIAGKQYGFTQNEFLDFFDSLGYILFDVHCINLCENCWDDDRLSYELVAIPKNWPLISSFLIETSRFWNSCIHWPQITSWGDCVSIGYNPPFLKTI